MLACNFFFPKKHASNDRAEIIFKRKSAKGICDKEDRKVTNICTKKVQITKFYRVYHRWAEGVVYKLKHWSDWTSLTLRDQNIYINSLSFNLICLWHSCTLSNLKCTYIYVVPKNKCTYICSLSHELSLHKSEIKVVVQKKLIIYMLSLIHFLKKNKHLTQCTKYKNIRFSLISHYSST